MAKGLGDVDIWDLDQALAMTQRAQDIAEWDNQIHQLQKEKALLKAQLTQKEAKLTNADWKTGEAIQLLT